MTTTADLLADAFARIREGVSGLLDGLAEHHLMWRPDAAANTISWLVWHLTRIQDDHLAAAFGLSQVWDSEGWVSRFDLPYPPDATGYGMSPEEAGALSVPAGLLAGYHEAVAARTASLLIGLGPSDLDLVVDERWEPPVTLAVRLVSVIGDDLQHLGQAAYVRGLAERS
jgi:hypothetical protein